MRYTHLTATLVISACMLTLPLAAVADTSLPPSIATSSLDVATILKVQNLWAQVQQLMSQINALVQPSATSTTTSTPTIPTPSVASSTPSASAAPSTPNTPPPVTQNTRSIAEALRAVITQIAHETHPTDAVSPSATTQTTPFDFSTSIAVPNPIDQTTDNTPGHILQLTLTLKRGVSGAEVRLLQEILATDSDIFASADISGTFGPKTEAAVKLFQQHLGVTATGIVGPQTRGKINDLLIQNNIMNAVDLQDGVLGDLGTSANVQDQSSAGN